MDYSFILRPNPNRHLLLCIQIVSSLIFTFFLFSTPAWSQSALRFNHLTSNKGLTSNNTTCLEKDKLGFLWIGTYGGLNRFDGSNVVRYTHTIGDSTTLMYNRITALYVDDQNHIWIGTLAGLSIFYPETSTFINFNRIVLPDTIIMFPQGVKSISEFDGKIWISASKTILMASKDSLHFELKKDLLKNNNKSLPFFLPGGIIPTDSTLWILSSKGPIYTEDGNTFYHTGNNPRQWPIFNMSWISSLINHSDSVIYFTTHLFPGIYIFHPRTNLLDSILLPQQAEHHVIQISSLCQPNEEEIWGSTGGYGLFRMNLRTRTSEIYAPDIKNPQSLSSTDIGQVIADEDGNVFITTDHGICWTNSIQPPFTILNTAFTEIKLATINVVAEDDDGNFWIATLNEGLFTLNRKENLIEHIDLPGSYNTVVAINIEDNNVILNTAGGLGIIPVHTRSFKPLPQVILPGMEDVLHFPPVFVIKDNYGFHWTGLYLYGLLKYKYQTGEYLLFPNSNPVNPLAATIITAATTDGGDTIWIGYGTDAISILNTKTNTVENIRFSVDEGFENAGGVHSLALDKNGNLWIATKQGGLIKYKINIRAFTFYDTRDGLTSNNLGSILVDHQDKIWINTPNGVNQFDPETETFTNYNASDGLSSNLFEKTPMTLAHDGSIFIWSDQTITWFNPKDISSNPNLPELVFSSYEKSGQQFFIQPNDHQLHFTHKDKTITFQFIGINFIDPGKTQYAYYLEGYDDDWHYSDHIPNATYTSIPTGDYTLHIKATNKGNMWDVPEKLMSVHITGPYWKSWWFIMLCFCTCILIAYYINYYRLVQFKKIQFIRNRISKDLHDDIGSTLSSISISSMAAGMLPENRFQEVNSTLNHISQNARNAMDNMSDIVWAINPSNDSFNSMIQRLQLIAIQLLEAKNIKLQLRFPEELKNIKLDMVQRKNVYLILREAIHNVAKYSEASTCIISGNVTKNKIVMEISDDGIGFEEITPTLGGNGIHNMSQRALEIHADLKIHSEKNKGTQLSLQLLTN